MDGYSTNELAEKTGLSVSGIEKNIKELKQKWLIRRIGSPKGGHWEITDQTIKKNEA